MVSVCMITYNHKAYIREAIEGVLMQKTNFLFELIIGEDCSKDNTRAIVQEYEKKYQDMIKAQYPETNRGMMNNFFAVLQSAQGKYIAICDGDDYWTDPYKLQKQVDFLEVNPDYGLVHTNNDRLDQKTGKLKRNIRVSSKIKDGYIFENIIVRNQIATLTVLVKRELVLDALQKNGDQIKKWKMGDYPLWLEISRHCKIKFLNESMAVYRVGLTSASSPGSVEAKIDFINSTYDVSKYFFYKYIYGKPEILNKIEYQHARIRFSEAFLDNNQDEINFFFKEMKRFKNSFRLPLFVLVKYYFTVFGLYKTSTKIDKFLKQLLYG